MSYNPKTVELKWRQAWFDGGAFAAIEKPDQPHYYVLEMLPYPSGQLHMGHVRNYTLGDVLARYKRAAGFNVLHPMGWDSFGLPAENAALKKKIHPQSWTLDNIATMKQIMNQFGWSYDWSREIASCQPDYYGHQQALFLDFLERRLAYRKESVVNWDPVEHTVLANEQVVDGKGWRSGVPVERRTMHQWHFRITEYAQELLDDLDKLPGWPERVKTMQRNWIGRSEGLRLAFDVEGWDQKLDVYTTRPDTIYGCTFCAVAPEHPLARQVAENDAEAAEFIAACSSLGTSEEAIEQAEKQGYRTACTATHPLTGEALPIYIANFVLMGYGTGAIMAVPAHDARDHAFAIKYDLPIRTVIQRDDVAEGERHNLPGTMVNSGDYTGMESEAGKAALIDYFEENNLGRRMVNWRLRDWGISRQRYWGCPIPIVHCGKCGAVPVPRDQLPLTLPEDVSFDEPGNPLERHPTWKQTRCPTCGSDATRETDTMDTFVDSSWYFLRYTCPQAAVPVEADAANYWMGRPAQDQPGGVDQYIGGIEHAVLHLLYARFFVKALRDMGRLDFDEPFHALLCQGMLIGNSYQTADGTYVYPSQVEWKDDRAFHKKTGEPLTVNPAEKISKSKNNGDAPDDLIKRFGADTLRLFILFTAPPERDLEWSEQAIEGAWRYLNRVWALAEKVAQDVPGETAETKEERDLRRSIHKTIRKVTWDVENFHYNTMVAACMELANILQSIQEDAGENLAALRRFGVEVLLRLLNPAVPHITEELWQKLGHRKPLYTMEWPVFDAAAAADEEVTLVVQVNGKLKARLTVAADIEEEEAKTRAREAVADQLQGLTVRKEIFVPGKLVNMVVN
jgi:leucyl-tRNA synthetase